MELGRNRAALAARRGVSLPPADRTPPKHPAIGRCVVTFVSALLSSPVRATPLRPIRPYPHRTTGVLEARVTDRDDQSAFAHLDGGQDRSDEPFRLLVEVREGLRDLLARPFGTRRELEPGCPAHQGIHRRRDRGPSLLNVLSARRSGERQTGARARNGHGGRAFRGRGMEGPEGRVAVLGQRRHHGAPRRFRW